MIKLFNLGCQYFKLSNLKIKYKTVLRARNAFKGGITKNVDFRIQQLNSLYKMMVENEKQFNSAVAEDLKKTSSRSCPI
ncbi:hypothetical protein CEXT_643091 [Caerostris extrusa]|uniref:Uncharacterized protein n=1 Tax=Caerostris extrusa TaxID=172846 RepID=A0AAV4Y1A2_CAEEX|nr:hypothetical protein CEXT_643091 [Caerostris extrusa]